MIDWTHFTPWASLAGGVMLGIAAAVFILVNGRILGISGIVGGLIGGVVGGIVGGPVRSTRGDSRWRIAFLLGMLAAPMAFVLFAPAGFPAAPRIDAGYGVVAVAGLLVGFGTRYGSGCTSGHGVCGLSRLSPRALAATLGFMAAGFITVFLVRHI